MAFRFKQFEIEDDDSTMKVGTDAILLGSWINTGNCKSILEIGTGSGVIALMLAQKTNAKITAIDIDENSVLQALMNVSNSKWSKQIIVQNVSFQDFIKSSNKTFDLIVSNPPFFGNSLKSPTTKTNLAKHNDNLSSKDLISGVKKTLSKNGCFYAIFPYSEGNIFREKAEINNLFCTKILLIKPKTNKPANRILFRFQLIKPAESIENKLTIKNKNNTFNEEFVDLTKDYYLD
ncbi:MAG: methyltransferase [Bacteroidales bacterium]|nr:methyltransferase [Bacteroidales bacterium]